MSTEQATTPVYPTAALAVTPSDVTTFGASAIYIGGAGNVTVVTGAGQQVTFTGALAGTMLPVQCTKVLASGLTASNIVRVF